jgi:hypothetical protein
MQTIIRVVEDSLMILLASAIVVNTYMLVGPTSVSGWSDTVEYDLFSQSNCPSQKHNLHMFLAGARILLALWCLGAMQPTNMSTYLVRTRYVSTSFMCETVDSLYATVKTH